TRLESLPGRRGPVDYGIAAINEQEAVPKLITITAHDLARIVDPIGNASERAGRVDCGVVAIIQQEAMPSDGRIVVPSDDLARGVDPGESGAGVGGGAWHVERGETVR